MSLSGNKDTDFLILMKLDDRNLGKMCQINKYVEKLCEDENFWRQRSFNNYSEYFTNEELENIKGYTEFSWKELYLALLKIRRESKYGYKVAYPNINKNFKNKREKIDKALKETIHDLPTYINKDKFIPLLKFNYLQWDSLFLFNSPLENFYKKFQNKYQS